MCNGNVGSPPRWRDVSCVIIVALFEAHALMDELRYSAREMRAARREEEETVNEIISNI